MAEIWDVYDENANFTGRTMERGIPRPGDYILCVHVYLCAPDGRFLIQKRSMTKESHPGAWDVTGGAVLAGEESVDAAIRETKEEIGIKLARPDLHLAGRVKSKSHFVDIYLAKKDFDIKDCVLQPEEVEDVKLVSASEMLDVKTGVRRRSRNYIDVLKNGIKSLAIWPC